MTEGRRDILWFGTPPGDAVLCELKNRWCVWRAGDPAAPLEGAALASAAVIWFETGNEPALLHMAETALARLVDYGLRVELVAADDAAMGRVQARLGRFAALPRVGVRTTPEPAALAEAIARHRAGPVPRLDLAITVPENREPLRQADEILFQRAFAHCSEITLVELSGGRSDARVFAVHMTVARFNAGAWPQPAFAKLDRNDKIAGEHENYREYAARFIPFGLRPNVESLIVGSERSLLVGDFVDKSESLWDLARRNVAGSAITALLEETLGGWRDQGYADDPVTGAAAAAMRDAGLWDPDKIQISHVERAHERGTRETQAMLWDALKGLDQRYRMAPIHGDLHGENVRVRGASAILIDLASVCRGPLTADLAALETWLAFELPPDSDPKQFEDPAWCAAIDRLYAPPAFRHPPGPCRPAAPLAWLCTVVRQIRTMGIAIQSCPTEYQTAVSVQLLRRCQWADGPPADRFRRSYGYRIAAHLVGDLQGGDA
jgi:hypothetical protein